MEAALVLITVLVTLVGKIVTVTHQYVHRVV